MKKYLLTKWGNFYKANLHCHTTVSDGRLSPEEMREIYKEKGYSIIAYTDHDVLISHNELSDKDFLALNAFEVDITEKKEGDYRYKKCCHICFIAMEPDNFEQPFYYNSQYLDINRDKMFNGENIKADFIGEYNHECINKAMKMGRENGFFITYNHPTWSLENYNDYIGYNNMNAMEIYNNGSATLGCSEYNDKEYDDMLRANKRIFCVATDDNHNWGNDSFGGFTMIKAEKLEYRAITRALSSGNFYASQGPEIYDLWYEDGKIGIKCSNVKKIVLNNCSRDASVINATEGETINSAEFEIIPEDIYVRITITDFDGKKANTNAYFTDEFFK